MTESMTEITKALRCCVDRKCGEYNRINNGIREDYVCSNDLHKVAADTIDRLTAELTDYRALAAEYGIDGKTMLALAKSQIETAKENAKLTERLKAAVEDIYRIASCDVCKHYDADKDACGKPFVESFKCFEWRGVKEERE